MGKAAKGLSAYRAAGFKLREIRGEKATVAFVQLIAGTSDCPVCFRMFADSIIKVRGGRAIEGTLYDCLPYLAALNEEDDYGLFLVINQGGHDDASISRVRAVFVDSDTDSPARGRRLDEVRWHLLPSFIVMRGNNWHAYWLVSDLPIEQFESTQLRLAERYGTDTAVSNLSRVMRLPGSIHLKEPDRPQEVKLIVPLPEVEGDRSLYEMAGLIYRTEEILEGLPPAQIKSHSAHERAKPESRPWLIDEGDEDAPENIRDFQSHLDRRESEWQAAENDSTAKYGFHSGVRNSSAMMIGRWGFAYGLTLETTIEVGGEWFFERCDGAEFEFNEFERACRNGWRISDFDFGERSAKGLRRIRESQAKAAIEAFSERVSDE